MDDYQALEVPIILDILTLKKNIENVRKLNKLDYMIDVFQILIRDKEDELKLLQCVEHF